MRNPRNLSLLPVDLAPSWNYAQEFEKDQQRSRGQGQQFYRSVEFIKKIHCSRRWITFNSFRYHVRGPSRIAMGSSQDFHVYQRNQVKSTAESSIATRQRWCLTVFAYTVSQIIHAGNLANLGTRNCTCKYFDIWKNRNSWKYWVTMSCRVRRYKLIKVMYII